MTALGIESKNTDGDKKAVEPAEPFSLYFGEAKGQKEKVDHQDEAKIDEKANADNHSAHSDPSEDARSLNEINE